MQDITFLSPLRLIHLPNNKERVQLHLLFVYERLYMKNYGGFLQRFIAFFIDNLIFIVPSYFIYIEGTEGFVVYVILGTAYFVWMNGTYGATIGKMVMNLKIVKEDGNKLNYSDAFLRELATWISLVVFGLGYLTIIWDNKKQGWHDKITKTVVIVTK